MLQWLDTYKPVFPSPYEALKQPEGLLCAGGNLETSTLLCAYKKGIFPWYDREQPILWWSPDPRMVLFPDDIHISTSMKKWLKKKSCHITQNQCFQQVIQFCAEQRANGTWITSEMKKAYLRLHEAGYAHSLEVWKGKELVGGLYGPCIGQVFFGESMFSLIPNASKMALIHLAQSMDLKMIDCQLYTDHLKSMGGKLIPRSKYLTCLNWWV